MHVRTLIDILIKEPHETEWLEFKINNDEPHLIGEYLSALSNSACLHGQAHGYLVYGIENSTHSVKGTAFDPHSAKGKGNEGLEPWLARLLAPRVDFRIFECSYDGKPVVLFRVDAPRNTPANELIEDALRVEHKMYPKVAVREFVANAIIHQDFSITGAGPMVEIFKTRLEITNPGHPLVDTDRFIDHAPRSRNEILASLMRRMNICEERGSGIDRALSAIEISQLPAPEFQGDPQFTRVTLFSYRDFKDMSRTDRVRACYQHSVLRWVCKDFMTNATLRDRLGVKDSNYPMVSKVIKDALGMELIKPAEPENKSTKKKYIPWWG